MTSERTGLVQDIEPVPGKVLAHVSGETWLPFRIVDDAAAGRIVALHRRIRPSRQEVAARFGLDVDHSVSVWDTGGRSKGPGKCGPR